MANDSSNFASCLTDNAVSSPEEDNLRAEDYAKALAQFITKASTPVTIGIQGGWGSGKTSLITLLKGMLESDQTHPVLCVVVNAWEHSLLQDPDNQSEIALSMLEALSEGLTTAVGEAKWLDPADLPSIQKNDDAVNKALRSLKLGAMFAGKVGLQMLSNALGTGDVSGVKMEEASKSIATLPKMATSVRKLRDALKAMVKNVRYHGKAVKIVFFIDDLDRVPPATAVEILDITKNIFDMEQCVFVLAIDYEVVVKGLEKKFGPKTKANEREFRQYFDKIIQIPFTMPMGAYGENLAELLNSAFKDLGYADNEENKEIMARLSEDAKLATGGIPRSIKRILNTLSLLQHIASAKQKNSQSNANPTLPSDIETRFIIVALHINFPEIARCLMERPDFTQWNPADLDSPWDLKFDSHKAELALLESDNLFNDPWEKVVYCLAADSPWLKTRARHLSQLLNRLLKSLGGDPDNATSIPDDGLIKLKSILKSISVVSVEPAAEGNVKFDTKDLEKNPVNKFFVTLRNELAKKNDSFLAHNEEVIRIDDDGIYRYPFDFDDPDLVYGEFDWDPEAQELSAYVVGKKPGSRSSCEETVEKMAGDYEWDWEDRNFFYYFTIPFSSKEFTDNSKIGDIADKMIALFNQVKKAQEKLFKS